jgi:hypothetical protein
MFLQLIIFFRGNEMKSNELDRFKLVKVIYIPDNLFNSKKDIYYLDLTKSNKLGTAVGGCI